MSRRRARKAPPPKLSSLIVLFVILGVIWLYQNGYVDRLLGQIPGAAVPSLQAPDLQDGERPEARSSPQAIVPQPSVPQPAAPPAENTLETQSLRGYSHAWYQVYFTKPRYPEGQANRVGGLDETLVADIGAAQRRVELVSFDLDLPRIKEALLQAKQRGVSVRVSIDGENLETPVVAKLVADLQAADIPVFSDERQAFMHNKFVIIDDTIVWMGSANLTVNDVFRNNNNMLRIIDQRLAQNYLAKADAIFEGRGGPGKPSVLAHPTLTLGGATVLNAFAPDEPITDMIVERINGARQSIDVLAFAFTSDPIADALIQARQRGLAVRAVMESRNAKGSGSEFAKLRSADIDIHADGNCYIMHNKVMIIDGQLVITGSFNFTRAAQEQNDENVLIIDDTTLAARYTEEFARIYQQALEPTRCQ